MPLSARVVAFHAAMRTGRGPSATTDRFRRVVAMQADLQPAGGRGGGVLEGLGQAAGPSEPAVGNLHAPGVADGPEHRLLVVPADPAHLDTVRGAQLPRGGRGDAPVYEHQLKPLGDALTGQVLQHQLGSAVLVRGRGHHQGAEREAGHIHRHDAFGALRAPVGPAAVVEGEPAVGGSAGPGGCR